MTQGREAGTWVFVFFMYRKIDLIDNFKNLGYLKFADTQYIAYQISNIGIHDSIGPIEKQKRSLFVQ